MKLKKEEAEALEEDKKIVEKKKKHNRNYSTFILQKEEKKPLNLSNFKMHRKITIKPEDFPDSDVEDLKASASSSEERNKKSYFRLIQKTSPI